MFLRANKRFKDGKERRYWSVVENQRVAGGRSVQKTLLYLGEINDSDRAAWTRTIEAVDERNHISQIHLFPEDRAPDPSLEHPALQLRLAAKDTLYRCHDRLLDHREALFIHLKDHWVGLFGASYDVLLYDLTSTYFEVDANGPVTEASQLKAFGYSRDKRPDCVQIAIALIITPDGRIEAHIFI